MPSPPTIPTVVTVHDFIYERFVTGPRRWLHSWQKLNAIRQAKAVICISESTRQDLLEFVGEIPGQSVHVIHNGVGDEYFPLGLTAIGRPFILFVGQRGGYKNFHAALDALSGLPDFELVCVGGGAFKPNEFDRVSAPVRERVRHAGFVTDAELNRLYNLAACLLYPSSYEGFGIPVLEAMRAGCPVVCGPCKAIQEVGADALIQLPNLNREGLVEAIERVQEPDTRVDMIRRGAARGARFSWETTFQQTLSVYESLVPTLADRPCGSVGAR